MKRIGTKPIISAGCRVQFVKDGGHGESDMMPDAENDLYSKLDTALKHMGLIQGASILLKPKRIEIIEISSHALQRFTDRQTTQAIAQSYIDDALVMIRESKDKYEFIAPNGSSVILEYGRLLTVIPEPFFTEKQKKKVEVIMRWLKRE